MLNKGGASSSWKNKGLIPQMGINKSPLSRKSEQYSKCYIRKDNRNIIRKDIIDDNVDTRLGLERVK